ncbi:MAG: 16S rRNA (guanine(527)-N(7))-methyltransferase RsmG [Shewanellaceae bacterium]|nr:16S rRNA (guanine(527)-N(7))-methyltransferase RsmG [Shewanellaceae bacterium]
MLDKRLDSYLNQLQLDLDFKKKKQLLDFVFLLNKWNKAYNLTSVRDPEQMLIRHVMDSLVVAPHLDGQYILDVGSGPGLPGIPLAIMFPEKQFVLLDSLGKRIRFQRQAVLELGLVNVTSVQERVEAFQPANKFDVVMSRAFASLKKMLTLCQHLPNDHGCFLALKGKLEADEIDMLPDSFHVKHLLQLHVPDLHEVRHLVNIIKT